MNEMFKKDRIKDDYIKGGAGKLILWLPTYREYDEGFIISILNKDELNSLNTYLMDNNIKDDCKASPTSEQQIHREWNYPTLSLLLRMSLTGQT